jgi:hypothetical protein
MALIRFIFIVFIIYLVFKVLSKYVLPFLVRKSVKNFQEKFYQQNPNVRRKEEGEVTIQQDKKTKEKSGDIGEYVDFEEVKDEKE